jgi:hypothetical protein
MANDANTYVIVRTQHTPDHGLQLTLLRHRFTDPAEANRKVRQLAERFRKGSTLVQHHAGLSTVIPKAGALHAVEYHRDTLSHVLATHSTTRNR